MNIKEGLIKTTDAETAIDILYNERFSSDSIYLLDGGKIMAEIDLNINDAYTDISSYDYNKLNKLFVLINNLGYFPSIVRYIFESVNADDSESDIGDTYEDNITKPYTEKSFYDILENKLPHHIDIVFDPKFSIEIDISKLPNTLWHITSEKTADKIRTAGLKPASKSKKSHHPERVYLGLDQDGLEMLMDGMSSYIRNPVIFYIDKDKLPKDIKFYNDPDFSGYGIYTYSNIPPNALIE